MTKIIKITSLLLLSFILVSCVQTQEIENIGIINAQGVDLMEDGSLETTLVVFQFSAQSDSITKIISGKGKTVEGAIEDAEHSSMYRLVPGKIKLTLFGEEASKKGVLPLLDAQARDTRVPDLMYLAIAKPTSKELLSIDEKNLSVDIGQFLHDLIENHTSDHNIPRKTLQDFLRIYYDVGQDNVLPIFEIKDDTAKHTSVALFMGDRVVGELSNNEIMYVNLMDRHVKEELMELTLPLEPFEKYLEDRENSEHRDPLNIAITVQSGKSKTKLVDFDHVKFETNTKLKVRLMEQSSGVVLQDSKATKLLEKEIEKEMERNFEKLLDKVTKLEADPFGYGRYYKKDRKGKDLTKKEWRKLMHSMHVDFNVDVELIRHGAID